MKKIKVTLTAYVEVPEKSEITDFQAEDFGGTGEHLRIGENWLVPTVSWMKFMSSAISEGKYGDPLFRTPGYEGVSDDLFNDYLIPHDESWYFEELDDEQDE